MWNSTFCPGISALLVLLVLGSSFIFEVTATSTNSSSTTSTSQVEDATTDGQRDASSSIISPTTPTTTDDFKPSPYFLESPLPLVNPSTAPSTPTATTAATTVNPTKKPASPRILKRRQSTSFTPMKAPMNYPGMVRKFDKEVHKLSQQQPPAVLTLFNGGDGGDRQETNDKENTTSSTVHNIFDPVGQQQEEVGAQLQIPQHHHHQEELNGEKHTRLYFDDIHHRQPSQYKAPGPSAPQPDYPANNENQQSSHHHGHSHGRDQHHHSQQEGHHSKGHVQGDIEVLDHPNHYYPKNLLSKQPPASTYATVYKSVPDKHHPHHHHHGHYGHHESEHHQEHHQEPHHNHNYPTEHGHHSDYRGHGHVTNSIGPVISRALQLLIPSALFITGASALFPNRVHVPTNLPVVPERQKRSAGPEGYVPSMYLKREHRTDDGGEDYEYHEESESRFGEKSPELPQQLQQVQRNFDIISTTLPNPRDSMSIPQFKPMPMSPSPPTTNLPIIRMNRMKPVEHIRKEQEYDAFNFDDYATEKNLDTKRIVPNSPTPVTRFISRRPPTILRPVKRTYPNINNVTPKIVQSPSTVATPLSTPTTTTTEQPTTTTTTEQPATTTIPHEDHAEEEEDSSASPEEKSSESPSTSEVRPLAESEEGNETNLTSNEKEEVIKKEFAHNVSSPFDQFENRVGLNRIERGSKVKASYSPFGKSSYVKTTKPPNVDLSPGSPVVGLLTNFASRDQDSPECQKRALCELALRGATDKGTKFEKFLWNLANLVPENLSSFYELDDTFTAVVKRRCHEFVCANPNLDLQEK